MVGTRSSRKGFRLGEVWTGFGGWGLLRSECLRGRRDPAGEGKGAKGTVGGVLGAVNGTELTEQSFSRLLLTVAMASNAFYTATYLLQGFVRVTHTLVSRTSTWPVR